MLTSALVSELRQLSRDVALYLRDVSDRALVSDILRAFGGCIGAISEISSENSSETNCRLLNFALRSLCRADTLIELGTDCGSIPESQGNRWLRRCRSVIPRLTGACKDSRRLAGLSHRLPEPTVLFSTSRLTVRSLGEGDLSFLVSLLGSSDHMLDVISSVIDCDSARRIVSDVTASVITRGDGNRVGVIFCTPDEVVEGLRWLWFAVASDQRGNGYLLEAVVGYTNHALLHGASAIGICLPPSKRFLVKALERCGYTSLSLCSKTVLIAEAERQYSTIYNI